MKNLLFVFALLTGGLSASAQQIHGTLRGKYEWQTAEKEGRFEVRTARISVAGDLLERVSYKAEIDLCDEGKIKMLDAYTRIKPLDHVQFTIGQMRVPFTIDAHRSPHQQYFANRSFIAKQVGNVRDVGATIGYTTGWGVLQAGLFNGSGLTNQKDFWTKSINFSAKAQFFIPGGGSVALSMQKIRPEEVTIMMYDAGAFYHKNGWHLEAEYLLKHYAHGAFQNVHAVDAFVSREIQLSEAAQHATRNLVKSVSPLLRYDFMSDHSDGTIHDDTGLLGIDDHQRHRLTGGVTISLGKPFVSDIRLNYEKYFYKDGSLAKTSERDKLVVEVMTRF